MIDRVRPLKRCAVILGGAGALFVLMYLLQGALLIGGLILLFVAALVVPVLAAANENNVMAFARLYAVGINLIVFIAAMAGTQQGPLELVWAWGGKGATKDGFWSLLAFAMQMALVLVLGSAMASANVCKRALGAIASLAHNKRSAILITTFVSTICCWLNWGFGLIAGALLAREVAKRVKDVDYPLLIAAAYSGFVIWHAGLSGSIPLQIGAEGGTTILDVDTLFDASAQPDNLLKGSVMATLSKKLVVNSVGVLFDLLGKLDNKKAIELLECMWVGMAEFIDMYISPCGGAFNEGYAHWEAVTVGGQTPDGRDATNELTHLILKSKREFPLHYPDLAARIHSRSPESYLWDVAETIKDGSGFPKLINDEEVVPLYVAKGATFEEALDYAVSGCTEARMPNRDTFTSGGAYINFAAAVEMVLRNGRMKKYGDIVLGEETGDPRNFKTWDEFWNAYVKQHMLFLRTAFTQQYIVNNLRAQHFAQPMGSAMHDLCMKHCIDLHQTHIPEGIDFGYFEYMGLGTVVDSLSAIKKLVFEDKKLTMDEVIKAIDANFEGYEDVKALLKSAPCYGNNDPYADSIGHEIDRLSVEFAAKYSQKDLGMFYNVRYVPFTSHVPFGKVVSATPNGRVDWFPLSDGSSASHGADVNGPTAVLLSNYNTKNMGMRDRFARMLNIKFTPKCVEGEQGTEKLVSFIRTFCDLKLWHVQFNVVNKSTLLAAQKDPQKYRNLIVRIAGYSAYFVDLSPDLQNDLIARTEHDTI